MSKLEPWVGSGVWRRRALLAIGLAATGVRRGSAAPESLRFGLTPVFVDSDMQLLSALQSYLVEVTDRPIELVQRRTYQEITAMLLADQIDAAWICGFPFVRWRDRLSLLAVPVYHGHPLYQSYLIVGRDRAATSFFDLKGDVHAFSDPDSNSGWLVTRHLLLEHGTTPSAFFSRTFFTYGHRNVVRAVAAGLAQSGSVDGYVWNVLSEREPKLASQTRILRRSEWLGFPPIAVTSARRESPDVKLLGTALVTMASSDKGRLLLKMLELDRFTTSDPSLFDPIARMYHDVEAAS